VNGLNTPVINVVVYIGSSN